MADTDQQQQQGRSVWLTLLLALLCTGFVSTQNFEHQLHHQQPLQHDARSLAWLQSLITGNNATTANGTTTTNAVTTNATTPPATVNPSPQPMAPVPPAGVVAVPNQVQQPQPQPGGAPATATRAIHPFPIANGQHQSRQMVPLVINITPNQPGAPPMAPIQAQVPTLPKNQLEAMLGNTLVNPTDELVINPQEIAFSVPNLSDEAAKNIIAQIRTQLGSSPMTVKQLNGKFVNFTAEVPGVLINRTMITQQVENQTDVTHSTRLTTVRGTGGYGGSGAYEVAGGPNYQPQHPPIVSMPYNPVAGVEKQKDSGYTGYQQSEYSYEVPVLSSYTTTYNAPIPQESYNSQTYQQQQQQTSGQYGQGYQQQAQAQYNGQSGQGYQQQQQAQSYNGQAQSGQAYQQTQQQQQQSYNGQSQESYQKQQQQSYGQDKQSNGYEQQAQSQQGYVAAQPKQSSEQTQYGSKSQSQTSYQQQQPQQSYKASSSNYQEPQKVKIIKEYIEVCPYPPQNRYKAPSGPPAYSAPSTTAAPTYQKAPQQQQPQKQNYSQQQQSSAKSQAYQQQSKPQQQQQQAAYQQLSQSQPQYPAHDPTTLVASFGSLLGPKVVGEVAEAQQEGAAALHSGYDELAKAQKIITDITSQLGQWQAYANHLQVPNTPQYSQPQPPVITYQGGSNSGYSSGQQQQPSKQQQSNSYVQSQSSSNNGGGYNGGQTSSSNAQYHQSNGGGGGGYSHKTSSGQSSTTYEVKNEVIHSNSYPAKQQQQSSYQTSTSYQAPQKQATTYQQQGGNKANNNGYNGAPAAASVQSYSSSNAPAKPQYSQQSSSYQSVNSGGPLIKLDYQKSTETTQVNHTYPTVSTTSAKY